MSLEWGTRIGDGNILTLAEAGIGYTISEQSLRVRESGGEWRQPSHEEIMDSFWSES